MSERFKCPHCHKHISRSNQPGRPVADNSVWKRLIDMLAEKQAGESLHKKQLSFHIKAPMETLKSYYGMLKRLGYITGTREKIVIIKQVPKGTKQPMKDDTDFLKHPYGNLLR